MMTMKIRCSYAHLYKAVYPPKCLGGKGCDVCNEKWAETQKAR